MKRILQEPLLHFLLIGLALFAVFALVNWDQRIDPETQIVVGPGRIEQLATVFEKTWQRPPTREELQGLIDDFVLEEVYYRQAVAMGIDRDDTIIRRRLRQKLEFLTDDLASLAQASDERLAKYLAEHPDKFRQSPRFSFRQVYFNPEKHSQESIEKQLEQLRSNDNLEGDPGLLPASFEKATRQSIDGTFGIGFSNKLDKLDVGPWQGPVHSGLGVHLIKLEQRFAGRIPELEEIRKIVEREWSNDQLKAARKNMNERLLAEYELVVHWPAEIAKEGTTGEGGQQ